DGAHRVEPGPPDEPARPAVGPGPDLDGLAIDPAHAAPPPPARNGGRPKPGRPAGGRRGGRRAASSQQLRSNISSFEQECKYFPLAELQLSEMSVPAGIVGGSQAISRRQACAGYATILVLPNLTTRTTCDS